MTGTWWRFAGTPRMFVIRIFVLVMAEKKPFVLRLDPELLKAVEKWAADEFRSTNGQLEWIISKTLKEAGRLKSKGKSE
jgi:hypothetical protein